MDPRLQRRIQRYGWDLAARPYETLWRMQLAPAQVEAIACAGLMPGEEVLDIACGYGVTSMEVAGRVAPEGRVLGVDLSDRMIERARERALQHGCSNARFERMDAEALAVPTEGFDVALCILGLMYVPDPSVAVREMRRIVRQDGRIVLAVWGERSRCGWAQVFPIVDAEVSSEVCPLFFNLGQGDALAALCEEAGLVVERRKRMARTLDYADGEEACDAAFIGGPVALAWSRLAPDARARVRRRYLSSISGWRSGITYRIPAEFVIVAARKA